MWRLRGCTRCGGDLLSDGQGSFTCLACGCDSTNGATPSRRQRPKAPTWSDKVAEAMAGFLEMVGVEDTA
jgi:tRNA(Ile2) C34 agmatinyltransferase TiaS